MLCPFSSIFFFFFFLKQPHSRRPTPTLAFALRRGFFFPFFLMFSKSAALQLLAEATHASGLEADWSWQRLLGCDSVRPSPFETEIAQRGIFSPRYFCQCRQLDLGSFSTFASLKILADKTLTRHPDPFLQILNCFPKVPAEAQPEAQAEAQAARRSTWWRTFPPPGGFLLTPPPPTSQTGRGQRKCSVIF